MKAIISRVRLYETSFFFSTNTYSGKKYAAKEMYTREERFAENVIGVFFSFPSRL